VGNCGCTGNIHPRSTPRTRHRGRTNRWTNIPAKGQLVQTNTRHIENGDSHQRISPGAGKSGIRDPGRSWSGNGVPGRGSRCNHHAGPKCGAPTASCVHGHSARRLAVGVPEKNSGVVQTFGPVANADTVAPELAVGADLVDCGPAAVVPESGFVAAAVVVLPVADAYRSCSAAGAAVVGADLPDSWLAVVAVQSGPAVDAVAGVGQFASCPAAVAADVAFHPAWPDVPACLAPSIYRVALVVREPGRSTRVAERWPMYRKFEMISPFCLHKSTLKRPPHFGCGLV